MPRQPWVAAVAVAAGAAAVALAEGGSVPVPPSASASVLAPEAEAEAGVRVEVGLEVILVSSTVLEAMGAAPVLARGAAQATRRPRRNRRASQWCWG